MKNNSPGPQLTATKARSRSRVNNMNPLGAGQQGVGDRTQQDVPLFSSNPETFTNYLSRYRAYVSMYIQSWECRKIINIIPDDALRKPPVFKGISDASATILKKKFDRLQLIPTLKRNLKLERLLGGSLTFMGIDADKDDPGKPYVAKTEKAKLRFINSIPVSRISRMEWEQDPLSEFYMRPSKYTVAGHELDVSRCLVWDGEPLFDPQDVMLTPYRANLQGFGSSVIGCMYDDIVMACGTRQAAYQMIQINGAIIAAVQDLQDLSGTNPGARNLNKIKDLVNQLSVFRAGIIDGEKVDIKQHSSTFGSVPDLLMMYLQVLSAASDIPASRFLGEAPGGLSSGDDKSSKENYYNMLDAYQHERITPQLLRICDIVGYAEIPTWDQERDGLEIEWPPLWNETALEQSERANSTIDYILKLVEAGLAGDEQAVEEINARGILSVKLEADELAMLKQIQDEAGGPDDPEGGDKKPDVNEELQRLKNGYFPTTLKIACQNTDEFSLGMQDEQEHLKEVGHSEEKIAEIVADHLKDDPQYYSKLRKAGLMNSALKNNEATKRGIAAGKQDKKIGRLGSAFNPYSHNSQAHRDWVDGYVSATQENIQNSNYPPRTMTQFQGLTIMVETPKGETRKGIDPVTKRVWQVVMPADYGELVCAGGVDGDAVDCCIGPDPEATQVWIISQKDLYTNEFDEHKVLLGCSSEDEAVQLYCSAFSDGKGFERLGGVESMDIDAFKLWLAGQTHTM